MRESLVWISGASTGIGQALVRTVPWKNSRVIGISRRPPTDAEHLETDLSDPRSWTAVGNSFRGELAQFDGIRAIFVHAAATVEPTGFAGEVDTGTYVAEVLLNSAAPQVLGHLFLAAARDVAAQRHLVMLTSGAARSVYEGWTAYGAGKAAVDQWVRNAGAEEQTRGGVHVLAVAPGTVNTDMQSRLRQLPQTQFPRRQKFLDLHAHHALADPIAVASRIWAVLDRRLDNGSVVDLRELPTE